MIVISCINPSSVISAAWFRKRRSKNDTFRGFGWNTSGLCVNLFYSFVAYFVISVGFDIIAFVYFVVYVRCDVVAVVYFVISMWFDIICYQLLCRLCLNWTCRYRLQLSFAHYEYFLPRLACCLIYMAMVWLKHKKCRSRILSVTCLFFNKM